MSATIPDRSTRDEQWDAPLTQEQWNVVRYMFQPLDRSDVSDFVL